MADNKIHMIDDQYWLEKGKSFIDGSIKRMNNEIKSLSKTIDGIQITYAILSAAFIAIFQKFELGWATHVFIYSIPIVLFQLSKMYLKTAHIPKAINFNYRRPSNIRQVYETVFEDAYRRLKLARIWYYVGTVASVLVLLGHAVYTNYPAPEEPNHYISSTFDVASNRIVVTGLFEPSTNLELAIEETISTIAKNKKPKTREIRRVKPFVINEKGIFHYDFTPHKKMKAISLFAVTTNESKEHSAFVSKLRNE